jgi:hypothetical protein
MPTKLQTTTDYQGVNWSKEDMAISLGLGCATQQSSSVKLQVPDQPSATAIGIVSSLACSTGVPNDTQVLRVSVIDTNSKISTQSLYAGRDTSEWAYDCNDVRPLMQHRRAKIFESFPTTRGSSVKCEAHKYVSILPIDKLSKVNSIKLEYIGSSGAITLQKISLIDKQNKQSLPITANYNFLADTTRWHQVENINQTSIYENLRAMPRTWLVPEVISAKSDEVLRAIKSSQLPDGRPYNPLQKPLKFKTQNIDANSIAQILGLSDTKVLVKTKSLSDSFLVLSDIYYPGWQASIDGKQTEIFQTNYVLRGVKVPEGTHTVKFEFKPMSFHLGAGISAAALCLVGYIFIKNSSQQNV